MQRSNFRQSAPAVSEPAPAAAPLKTFGRFELRALLSKSARGLTWRVFDARHGQELMLCMPREKPNSAGALEHWLRMAQAGSRVQHPQLAPVFEIGQVESWPYVAYDRALGETLDERLARQAAPVPLDAAGWVAQLLEGLAFAHEAGHAHRDIQTASLVIDAGDKVRLIGLEVAQEVFPANVDFTTVTRRAVRESAEEDVLCVGLLLNRILSGKPVLEQNDLQAVVQQMQPLGREMVRLGWETPHPIPDPLRAICNRATDRQTRQRYHLARSFLRALDGWRQAASYDDGGPIVLLLDKLQRIGHLPTTTTGMHRFTAGSGLEAQHASALSELVLKDMALTLELVRRVNNALKQNGHAGETILNMQRAIQMLGLDGLQGAANALKPWPGPLQPVAAEMLRQVMARVAKAGQLAQALRPAGYDGEVVYLITLMQNLGRLLVQYHFPDDAQQIRQLILPPEPTEDQPHPQGLSEQAAAYAVLGADLDALGAAVARHWGLGDELLQMVRRQPLDAPVHPPRTDADTLRLTGSFANELVDALGLPEARRRPGVEAATRRYAKALGLGLREVMEALNPGAQRPGTVPAASPAPAASPSPLRQRLAGRS
ncbi:serine/threonine protein kinase [Roseateles cellulosilyticus]|uniref:HDOD domain-containing protein n=1 Tax=Pelomonas cellulosilytica TaxID=2906762 RepID=A0ABS8XKQ0_9BURK|nr:HDOD domain-containing protein [Pelomonas sp. P8]MCE4553404.1 HDOD domain-containing protein [Pelomonas sp. P8]